MNRRTALFADDGKRHALATRIEAAAIPDTAARVAAAIEETVSSKPSDASLTAQPAQPASIEALSIAVAMIHSDLSDEENALLQRMVALIRFGEFLEDDEKRRVRHLLATSERFRRAYDSDPELQSGIRDFCARWENCSTTLPDWGPPETPASGSAD